MGVNPVQKKAAKSKAKSAATKKKQRIGVKSKDLRECFSQADDSDMEDRGAS